MSSKYLDYGGLSYLWTKLKAYFQVKLVSGTNIKTINNQSILGSGNITVSGSSTSVPTANASAAFDSTAHMNSTDMSTSEVQDFVDDLEGQGANLADYVIEQGTESIWTYRKWASGIAECWGKVTVASRTYAANGGYYNVTGAPPTGLFVSGSNPVLSATGGITSNVQTNIGFTFASDVSIQTYLINRNTSAITNTAWVCWHLTGRWK